MRHARMMLLDTEKGLSLRGGRSPTWQSITPAVHSTARPRRGRQRVKKVRNSNCRGRRPRRPGGKILRFLSNFGEFITFQNGPSKAPAPTKGFFDSLSWGVNLGLLPTFLQICICQKGTAFAVPFAVFVFAGSHVFYSRNDSHDVRQLGRRPCRPYLKYRSSRPFRATPWRASTHLSMLSAF